MYYPRGYERLTNGKPDNRVVTNEKRRNLEFFGADQSLDVIKNDRIGLIIDTP